MSKITITSPVGRYVQGSLYVPQTVDDEGNPLVFKKGPDAGKPRVTFFFAMAIPKNPGETHWNQTEWGKQIFAVGHQAHPGPAQSPTFAWKIEDGDSTIPNTKGKKNCDRDGFPGNWIVKFSGGGKPGSTVRICRSGNGTWVNETTEGFIKPGDFIQVNFTVEGNGDDSKSKGVYLNHNIVAFSAYGPRIEFGPDAATCGFGQAPLPPGASAVPLASTAPLPADNGFSTPAPVIPTLPLMPGGVAITPAPTIPVIPNVAFAGIVAPPPPPPPAPVRQLTALAQGATYEQLKAGGWTDELLVSQGLMVVS